ncbi:MAG: hypothetical protein ACYTF1_08790 [Planctomycetota bacterium]|jgi:hypothetical protein
MNTPIRFDRIGANLLVAILAIMVGTVSVGQSAEPSGLGRNIARGANYVVSPQPRYAHCTDPDDATQLTDGQSTKGYFWTQKGTVGWQAARYVTITVDLGRIMPIGGAAFRTAAGMAGVTWPAKIGIFVSDENKAYREVGDLVVMDEAQKLLKTAADQVLNEKSTNDINWHDPKDRTTADDVCVKLLKALSKLSKKLPHFDRP